MNNKFFITGTDTGIGKTYISVGLINAFNKLGYSTLGIKPVATGCFRKSESLFNDDALQLQQASSLQLQYHQINPFSFEPPIAPNIAAIRSNTPLNINIINAQMKFALNSAADIHIVEGVGGWNVPLNDNETMADFVIQHNFTVILVVGIRVGCLNHALLTYNAIQNSKIPFAGWFGNCFEPAENTDEVIDTLLNYLKIPYLGRVNFKERPEEVLDTEALLRM